MAITKIIPIHTTIGKSIDYICNPNKTENLAFVHSENCFPQTASLEFTHLLQQARAGGNTLGRHLIQSFAPGEVTPDQAHRLGKELATLHLKGEYAYVMTTHVDREHIHNHFVWCAVNVKTHTRYRSNRGTYRQIRTLSDSLCSRQGLSVIERTSSRRGKNYGNYQRVKKLYNLEGQKFQNSPGLTHWGKIQNLKIKSQTVNLLQEQGLTNLDEFDRQYAASTDALDVAKESLKSIEVEITQLTALQRQLHIYGRTKATTQQFSKARNKDKFLRETVGAEADILLYEAAKQHLTEYRKVHSAQPKSSAIRERLSQLRTIKDEEYTTYHVAKERHNELSQLHSNLQKILRQDKPKGLSTVTQKSTEEML